MATVFSHPAVAISFLPWFRSVSDRPVILAIGVLLTVIPDLDVIGFRMGIPYESLFGHRGFSHSMVFAAIISSIAAWGVSRQSAVGIEKIWLYFFLCAASHGFIDAFTNGGHGVAFFAPFSEARYFFQYQPIAVSPISLKRFLSGRGIAVIKSELLWVWIPCFFVFISEKYFQMKSK